jgi:hypothetical protein
MSFHYVDGESSLLRINSWCPRGISSGVGDFVRRVLCSWGFCPGGDCACLALANSVTNPPKIQSLCDYFPQSDHHGLNHTLQIADALIGCDLPCITGSQPWLQCYSRQGKYRENRQLHEGAQPTGVNG